MENRSNINYAFRYDFLPQSSLQIHYLQHAQLVNQYFESFHAICCGIRWDCEIRYGSLKPFKEVGKTWDFLVVFKQVGSLDFGREKG
jgi:hypothetical protein